MGRDQRDCNCSSLFGLAVPERVGVCTSSGRSLSLLTAIFALSLCIDGAAALFRDPRVALHRIIVLGLALHPVTVVWRIQDSGTAKRYFSAGIDHLASPHRLNAGFMAPGMMCFGKKSVDPESRRNEDIEKQLRVDRKRQEREVKLLLLGMPRIQVWTLTAWADDYCRRWRERQVDRAEADARHSCWRLHKERAQAMAGRHLQQLGQCLPDTARRNGRAPH